MKTRYETIAGGNFDAGVIVPGPLQPAGITAPAELRDDYLTTLTTTAHKRDLLTSAEREEINELVVERVEWNKRAVELLAQVTVRSREKIHAEHEAAKAAVREQQERINQHKEKIVELTRELNRRNDTRAIAISARDAAQLAQRQLSRFASRQEIDAARRRLEKCEREADQATEQTAIVQSKINQANLVELKPLMEKLNELIADEMRLNHAVTGQGYTNDLGIVVPATAPI